MKSSKFMIDDLEVIFPFPSAYPEQKEYMTQIKLALDANGPALLEMPSGTGKTVSLLSVIMAYMSQRDGAGPLIYCTRTIPELDQGVAELKNVQKTRLENSDLDWDKSFLGIALSCRANLCVFPSVCELTSKKDVDIACRAHTVPYAEDVRCNFFDHVLMRPKPGVYGLNDLKDFGNYNGLCPYFLSRRLVSEANVIMCSFAYTLDPTAREILKPAFSKNAIVVFDEAHNIDDVCCEFMSGFVTQSTVTGALAALKEVENMSYSLHEEEQAKLQEVYDKLREGLRAEDESIAGPETLDLFKTPQLPEHIKRIAMPAKLRNLTDFVAATREVVRFFDVFIRGIEKPGGEENVHAVTAPQVFLMDGLDEDGEAPKIADRYSVSQVLTHIQEKCDVTPEVMQYMNQRLYKFLSYQKIADLKMYSPLMDTLSFASLLATYDEGYCVAVEDTLDGMTLRMVCLDSSLAFQSVLNQFNRVIVTSGTLSPLHIYPLILNFEPVTQKDFTMSLSRECLLPLFVTKGLGGVPLSSSYKLRSDPRVGKGYGDLLLEFCKIIPDGVVCFFPSYIYMQLLFQSWVDSGLINEVMKYKLVFVEADQPTETSVALENYKKAIENGRGAVFLGVARGRVSEGIDFADHYGRCVLLFGLPVRNTQSMIVQTRADFIETKFGMPKQDFLVFDAMRAASQCVGRLLRSKNDYGIVVLADSRYARPDARSQLPHWISQFVGDSKMNISVENAVAQSRTFMLRMAQPFQHDPDHLIQFKK